MNDPVQARIHFEENEMTTRTVAAEPSTVNVETSAQADTTIFEGGSTILDPVQARIRADIMNTHAQAEIQKAAPQEVDPNAPPGMTAAALSDIASGKPDPNIPADFTAAETFRNMTLPMLQQYTMAVEAKLTYLEKRFENLIGENFPRGNY